MKSWTVDDTSRLKKIIDRLSAEDGKYICRAIYRDPLSHIYLKLNRFTVFMPSGMPLAIQYCSLTNRLWTQLLLSACHS